MAPLLLLTDVLWPWARRLLFNKITLVVLIAAAMYAIGYFKGRASVNSDQVSHQIGEIAIAEVEQEKIEVAHDARVRKILSSPVPDADAARMLSEWPDQASNAR